MIKVTYFYSACVAIETAGFRVICDPWFTEGAYDGSWYQFPKLRDPLEKLGKADWVYVSHIHPDHYDGVFLKGYLQRYPATRVMIADFKENFLSKKMKKDGIPHEIITELHLDQVSVRIFPNELSPNDIDSALVVKNASHSVVNLNDNLFNEAQLTAIRNYCGGPISIALMGYTGAGPYPQTYYTDEPTLRAKAEAKKKQFFDRYLKMKAALQPKVTIPFAGKYILGGKLHGLNEFRGVADAVEISEFDSQAVVLADGGDAWIDTEHLEPSALRSRPYAVEEVRNYAASLSTQTMRYEDYLKFPAGLVQFERMLPKAYQNAVRRSLCKDDYFFCISLPSSKWFVLNAKAGSSFCSIEAFVDQFQPRSEIVVDYRYLFGLLTGLFHWNNAEVGSQFMTHRVPDIFNREAQGFLNFFSLL